jgi:hypothetical protein
MGKLSEVNNGGRERVKRAHSSLKKGRGIYTPLGIVAVDVLQGRIFRSKFGWSWACWKHHNKLYNLIYKNIVVQQRRVKSNEERFDLSSNTNR